MGITQVPPVPTPVTKGDIVVGTATGPARLSVGTTANQTLLVDSTTATGLKYGSSTLTTTYRVPTHQTSYTITGFSYTNPNVTFTTSAAHGFQVGQYVLVSGVAQAGATQNVNSTYTITAVTSTTFTASLGATAPSAYSSGGVVTNYFTSADYPNGGKYVNGVYFVSAGPNYFYSTDTITWNTGSIPSSNPITSIDWDGSVYAVSVATSGIWTSSTLANGSWTQRSTFGGFFCHEVKWCAGSVSRWVAVGSGDTSAGGSSTRIETATSGGVTWTSQSITGTNNYATYSLAFDGSNTILGFNESSGALVSTSGAGSWTFTTNLNSYYSIAANQRFGYTNTPTHGFYNTVNSRWYAMAGGSGLTYYFLSTSGAPNTYWQRSSTQHLLGQVSFRNNNAWYNGLYNGMLHLDLANGRFFTAQAIGGTLNIITYSATAVAYGTYQEYFPITGSSYAPLMPGIRNGGTSTVNPIQTSISYQNGKWIVLQASTTTFHGPSFIIAVCE